MSVPCGYNFCCLRGGKPPSPKQIRLSFRPHPGGTPLNQQTRAWRIVLLIWAPKLGFVKINGMFRATNQITGIGLSNLHSLGSVPFDEAHEVWHLSFHV